MAEKDHYTVKKLKKWIYDNEPEVVRWICDCGASNTNKVMWCRNCNKPR